MLTPDQMFSILPIFLRQSHDESNSQKQKREIRQLIYSVYRSKKIAKPV